MEPSFDTWTILFTVASFQGLFLSVVLFLKDSRGIGFLAGLILSFSICLGFYITFWTGYYQLLPWQLGALQGLTFLFGPLLYFYFREYKRNDFLHFLPFGMYVIFYMLFANYGGMVPTLLALSQIIHLIAYCGLMFSWLSSQNSSGNGNRKHLKWRQALAWAFSGYTASFTMYYFLVWTGLLKIEYDYMISLASSFLIYFIGYYGFLKPDLLSGNGQPRYDRSSLNDSAARSIKQQLDKLVTTEKLYLESLRLQDFASRLGISTHHISQAVNELEGKNFPDYINEFRISEAKRLLLESDDKIIDIAYRTGFNNKASFHNAFRKKTGMSPSEFREKNLLLT